ncbi:hypothetical protein PENSPDRAFT_687033 [Peniophora sp. CONT]|nr:hypothetical protein PENSPDRAFT_687033 [Peniophora sp. CONT]
MSISGLASLPVELIVEIALWAQLIWREDTLGPHAPYAGMKRYDTVPPGVLIRDEDCCCEVNPRDVPCCLTVAPAGTTPSPAHRMAQTGRWLRNILIVANSRVWQEDNSFYKEIAARSGVHTAQEATPDSGAQITYGARSFIALGACACLTLGMASFYSGLQTIRVELPWHGPKTPSIGVERFFLDNHDEERSPLQHFDLRIFESHLAPTRVLIRGVSCPSLKTSRTANTSYFYFSTSLTSLYIYHPHRRTPEFGMSFSDALVACASSLEYLTIDAASGHFDPEIFHVHLSQLRFLRLVAPVNQGCRLLAALQLPSDLDIHLEPVVNWRALCSQFLGAAFAENVMVDTVGAGAMWRYASALAAPHQSGRIFSTTGALEVDVPDGSLWERSTAIALDVRLDPSTTSFERACRRFPEYVSMAFAGSALEMHAVLADPGRDWAHSLPPGAKSTVRRSLTVRGHQFDLRERARAFNPTLAKPVYDAVGFVARSVMSAQTGRAFEGHPGARCLVFHPGTWLPKFSVGWLHFLSSFEAVVEIIFLCPFRSLCDGQITDNIASRLDVAHLEALALCLNEPGEGHQYLCSRLERIEVHHEADAGDGCRAVVAEMDGFFNGTARISAGSKQIKFSTCV